MKTDVAVDIRKIFNAPSRHTSDAYLVQVIHKYAKTASKLAGWLERNFPEGLTILAFPVAHQCRLRTTNLLERLSREIHRWTNVVSIFPIEKSCLRLISAFLMERD